MNKNNIFCLMFTIIIICLFLLNLLIIINKFNAGILNDSINLGGDMTHYDYDKLLEYVDVKYIIQSNVSTSKRSYKYESSLISFAKEATEKLFDSKCSTTDFINKYYIRNSMNIFGLSDIYYSDSYMAYLLNKDYFTNLKNVIVQENSSYTKIKDIKVYYGYSDYYIIQVYLQGVDNINDKILEYRIIYEESSHSFKVSNVLYFNEEYVDEYKNNNSVVKRFNVYPSNQNNDIYDTAIGIKDKYINSLVKIDVYDESKQKIDTVTGVFIDTDLIITTFDVFNNSIYRRYDYVVENMNGTKLNFDGLVTFSRNYNIAIIKVSEKSGVPVKINYNHNLSVGDAVFVPSIDGNIYVGTLLEILNTDYTIRSTLPLNKSDRGGILLSSSGKVIGINTQVNQNSDVLLSIEPSAISLPYDNIISNTQEIEPFKLNFSVLGIR